ncbi:hypothetical protein I4U23_026238 [Adineta vaga]|nr:hypothetical protein I4U23_026238 [Adineta vaga]
MAPTKDNTKQKFQFIFKRIHGFLRKNSFFLNSDPSDDNLIELARTANRNCLGLDYTYNDVYLRMNIKKNKNEIHCIIESKVIHIDEQLISDLNQYVNDDFQWIKEKEFDERLNKLIDQIVQSITSQICTPMSSNSHKQLEYQGDSRTHLSACVNIPQSQTTNMDIHSNILNLSSASNEPPSNPN